MTGPGADSPGGCFCHTQPVVNAGAAIQWGDVATWVGGAATAAALLLTYGLLRITRHEQRATQIGQRQSQARLISAWTAGIRTGPRDPAHSADVILQNHSDEPVYGLRAAVGFGWGVLATEWAEVGIVHVLPPKSRRQEELGLPPDLGEHDRAPASLPVELLFSDAAGHHWHRDQNGVLTEITASPPLAGADYFFRPRPRPR